MSEADAFDLHAALLITLDHARYSLGFCNITQHRQRVCWVTMCWCKMVFFFLSFRCLFDFMSCSAQHFSIGNACQYKFYGIMGLWVNGFYSANAWNEQVQCTRRKGTTKSLACSRKFNGRNVVGLAGTNESIRLFSPHTHTYILTYSQTLSNTHKHSQTLTDTHKHSQTLANMCQLKFLVPKYFEYTKYTENLRDKEQLRAKEIQKKKARKRRKDGCIQVIFTCQANQCYN